MGNNLTLRNQIIIPEDYPEDKSENYSDIELAAVYSKNNTNLIIFEELLLKTHNDEETLNDLLIKIILNITKKASIDAIKLLIKNGVNLNYTKHRGWTAPIYCCMHLRNIEIIKLLIENGADINIKHESEYSLLTFKIEHSYDDKDLEIIKLLIRKGSQINYKNRYGETQLMIYSQMNHNKLIKFEIIKLMLDNKVDIYIQDNEGNNILKYLKDKTEYNEYYSLIFNYKNLENDHFCECDINFIYYHVTN